MDALAATVPAQAVHPDTTDCPNVFIANDHREVPKQWEWIQTFRGVLQSQLVSQLFSRLSLLCKSSEEEQYEWRFYVIWSLLKCPFPWEILQVFPSAQLLQQQHTLNLPVSFDNLLFSGYSREISQARCQQF